MREDQDIRNFPARRPRSSQPDARFVLWRPLAHPCIELQTGIAIDEFALPFHFHDSYQFDLVVQGAKSYGLRRGHRALEAGRLCVMHPGEGHAFRLAHEASSFLTMHVDADRLTEAHEKVAGRREQPAFPFAIEDWVIVELFLEAHRALQFAQRFEADCALAAFLDELVLHHAGAAPWKRDAVDTAGLRLARTYIEDHLDSAISLDSLALAAGTSKFHLVRQFSRAFGLPPHAYQIRLRIARARELLAKRLPVKLVSFELGFADQSHFGRHFRKATGLAPAEYQRQVTGRGPADIRI